MLQSKNYRVCTKCVMDTSDPDITFDQQSVCNHCKSFEELKSHWHPDEHGALLLDHIVKEILKKQGNREYPCVMGLSGGVDSSYLAYVMVKKYGIKPLMVHVDAGWNSELAVKNIENVVKKLDLDLYTYVVDWEEKRDLQLAFLKAAVANQDTPQDHAFFAKLAEIALEKDLKYILSGHNYATESILPGGWGYNAMDNTQLRGIHRRFGQLKKLKTFPTVGFFRKNIWLPHVRGVKTICPLNYLPYNKEDAMKVLTQELGWQYYGGKHYESRFTKFFQSYYLPMKFGYDKRRAHLSSLIVSGQMTREEALRILEQPPYDLKEIDADKDFIAKKLGISLQELEQLLALPNKYYTDYPNDMVKYRLLSRVRPIIAAIIK